MSFFLVSQGYQDNLTGFTRSTGGMEGMGVFPQEIPYKTHYFEKPRVLHGFSPPGGLLVVLHRDQLLAMTASGTTSSMASSENRVPHGAPPVISHHLPKVEV